MPRQSPSESATLFKVGTKKIGNDGNRWIVSEIKNGVQRWKLFRNLTYRKSTEEKTVAKTEKKVSKSNKSTKYNILDNGGNPFTVHVYKTQVEVYRENDNKLIFTFDHPLKVWIGDSMSHDKGDDGNSIVVQIKHDTYVYIGSEIYQFQLSDAKEKVVEYVSHIGNSGVPYPYLLTNKNIYFMCEKRYASRDIYSDEDIFNDPYIKFYESNSSKSKSPEQGRKIKHVKVLHRRVY